jgi:pimeloyl-ACP methyl ester carboxylesterase
MIERQPLRKRSGLRLLFAHGISVGAWVWDAHFLPYFADAGFASFAFSLRGHGGSSGRERLHSFTIDDYTRDLNEAAVLVGGPVVVIGHSLGGAVAQNWIRTDGRAAGVALVAAVPPWGLAPSAWRMSLHSPRLFHEVLLMSTMGVRHVDPAVLRGGLFSDDVTSEEFTRLLKGFGDESRRIGPELQGWRIFAPMPWLMPPLLVLGGVNDKMIPADEIWRTALYYGTSAQILADLAHAVMLEPRWESAARALLDWLLTLPDTLPD